MSLTSWLLRLKGTQSRPVLRSTTGAALPTVFCSVSEEFVCKICKEDQLLPPSSDVR